MATKSTQALRRGGQGQGRAPCHPAGTRLVPVAPVRTRWHQAGPGGTRLGPAAPRPSQQQGSSAFPESLS